MLLKNQVLEYKPDGSRWRVLDMDTTTQTVWLFNMKEATALPEGLPADLFQPNGKYVEVEPPRSVTKLKPSEAAKRRRDEAYACIEPLVATMDIFEPSLRSTLVQARAEALDCSPQTIYKYLRTWWRNGQNRQALTPQFHLSGNIAGTTGGRGRPSEYGTPTYQMQPADQTLIQKILKTMFLTSELHTLEATYQALLEQHYSYVDAEGRLMLKLPGDCPSLAQFRWHARKHLPAELVIRSRKGDAEFELNHREVLGSLRHATFTVGDVYEIDSTVADVFLVHQGDRSKIVGKPCLYMVRDRKSNLIVGHYVGFEEASWVAALQAIVSITEDKEALCQRYGVPYKPAEWPAHRVMPKEFVADRGSEMLSNESTKIADGLELTVTNNPARRGDMKPHVECGFKQTNRAMRGIVPGYEPPENFGKRQTYDYSQDASLTLKEFRELILKFIIKHNNAPMPGYRLAPQYLLQSIQPTPLNIWDVEIRDRAGLLSTYTEDEVRLALLPQADVTVTREGIRFGDCFYSAKDALDKGWFVAAGKHRLTVRASYDLRLVDTIYIHDESNPDLYFEAHLLDKCWDFRGMSHQEVAALGYLARELNHHGKQLTRQMNADFHGNIAPTVSHAIAETKKVAQGKSRSARKKDTRAAREDARRHERQESARPAAQTALDKVPAAVIPLPAAQPPSPSDGTSPSPAKPRPPKYQELLNGK